MSPTPRNLRTLACAVSTTLAGALLLPVAAEAGDLALAGPTVIIYAGGSAPNDLTVSLDGTQWRFADSTVMLAGLGCTTSSPYVGRCPAAGIEEIVVALEAGDDGVAAGAVGIPLVLDGGAGQDELGGGAGADELAGGPGADDLHGGAGADVLRDDGFASEASGDDRLFGDAGDDTLMGAGPDTAGAGADHLDGGANFDTADYAADLTGVVVDLAAGTAEAGTGDDTLISVERVVGGGVADRLTGDAGANTLQGRGGDDALAGAAGADRLEGGAGSDSLTGGPGADAIWGGAGFDTVSYGQAAGPVLVALDDQAGDGEDGENDDVRSDVEHVVASPFGDDVKGSVAANRIDAGAGDDTVDGGDNADEIAGGDGLDHIAGGAGRDAITPGAGPDEVESGTGDDTIDAADGEVDKVTCGIGIDTVTADPADVLFTDCELVTRVAPPADGPGGGSTPIPETPPTDPPQADPPRTEPAATLAFRGSTLRVDRRGRGRIAARCTGVPCRGTLVLRTRRRTLARAPYALAAGSTARVPFRLTRRARALLRRTGRLQATAAGGAVTRRYAVVRAA
jgi:Ca2+-binding RTX toxin-like protein